MYDISAGHRFLIEKLSNEMFQSEISDFIQRNLKNGKTYFFVQMHYLLILFHSRWI